MAVDLSDDLLSLLCDMIGGPTRRATWSLDRAARRVHEPRPPAALHSSALSRSGSPHSRGHEARCCVESCGAPRGRHTARGDAASLDPSRPALRCRTSDAQATEGAGLRAIVRASRKRRGDCCPSPTRRLPALAGVSVPTVDNLRLRGRVSRFKRVRRGLVLFCQRAAVARSRTDWSWHRDRAARPGPERCSRSRGRPVHRHRPIPPLRRRSEPRSLGATAAYPSPRRRSARA